MIRLVKSGEESDKEDGDSYGDEDGFVMPDLDEDSEEEEKKNKDKNESAKSVKKDKKVKLPALVKLPQAIISQVGAALRDF